ncbi:MAG: flagellar biosynthesis protein FlgA [Opitutae bacterium]|nr:flagellar biosynthesis protein FlgA [Opitutae bacterium]|tara:strand:+ start:107 stop:1216 length:1110 start_codon:yes stop_codon:yes gene_type:complete
MVKTLRTIIALAFFWTLLGGAYGARIKDITTVKGARSNQLYGYGIVVGLAGQGDSKIEYTQVGILNALETLGIRVDKADKSRNIAAVIITAEIGPFAKEGSKIDVLVSSAGDADSLQGGVLMQAPLFGADGKVYAVAQGPLTTGGIAAGGQGGAGIQINHPTVASMSDGAIVEREIPMQVVRNGHIDLLLRNHDSNTAVKLADAINVAYPGTALATDFGTVNLRMPELFTGQAVNFIATIGNLEVDPEVPARIILNERTGTVVATEAVRISPVTVSHSNITVFVNPESMAIVPSPFTAGVPTVIQEDNIDLIEETGRFQPLEFPLKGGTATVQDLTSALNKLGVTTREMSSILQSIKRAGALQAELILN